MVGRDIRPSSPVPELPPGGPWLHGPWLLGMHRTRPRPHSPLPLARTAKSRETLREGLDGNTLGGLDCVGWAPRGAAGTLSCSPSREGRCRVEQEAPGATGEPVR